MFDDTDIPTCLALFVPGVSPQTWLWDRSRCLGSLAALERPPQASPCVDRVVFNVPGGQLGLRAVDSVSGPDLGFCAASAVPADRVNAASRLITRVSVSSLAVDPVRVAVVANRLLRAWRSATCDALLTAFTSHRGDGEARRRLDYASARALLSAAVCELESCTHLDA